MSEQLSLVQVSNCTLTTTGAEFAPALEFNQWVDAGKKLCRVSACVNWWIGDWINYGEKAYGEKYIAATEATGIDGDVLRQYAYISNAVETSTRVDNLTWSHHREVASLKGKDQRHWLALASENKWSVSQLRQSIRASQSESREQCSDGGTNLSAWALEGLRWLKAHDVSQMGAEQRRAIKEALKPFVEVYERL